MKARRAPPQSAPNRQWDVDDDDYLQALQIRPKLRWLFDDDVNEYVDEFMEKAKRYAILSEGLDADLPSDQYGPAIAEIKVWMRAQRVPMQQVFEGPLRRKH